MNDSEVECPYLESTAYQTLIQHPIMQSFFKNKANMNLFSNVLSNPNESNKNQLDQAFKEFYLELRLTKYISTLIHYSSIDFDKKQRRIQSKSLLILDQPLPDLNNDNLCIKESIPQENGDPETIYELKSNKLEDQFSDSKLFKAIQVLTPKEKSILTLAFINHLSDTQIANHTAVSQQAVTKMKKNALKKLRESIKI
ncbi:sigma-70 family RNA polymerase sigma factor [Paenibacillus sp. SI8]|uniref:sigma-70 family RNA polymerase sigma factor n=1 Tax=unclassified Paenibacillus TaxID=185978 RepID=UPI0034668600